MGSYHSPVKRQSGVIDCTYQAAKNWRTNIYFSYSYGVAPGEGAGVVGAGVVAAVVNVGRCMVHPPSSTSSAECKTVVEQQCEHGFVPTGRQCFH